MDSRLIHLVLSCCGQSDDSCASLVGGAGTTYASSRAGYQYMRIDGVEGAGYLTAKGS